MIEVRAPAQSEGTRASLARWLKAVGDTVALDEPLAELETDKVAVEIASPGSGVVAELLAGEGADVEPGALIARLAPPSSPSAVHLSLSAAAESGFAPPPFTGEVARSDGGGAVVPGEHRLSPAVRRALAERGIAPDAIAGTGRGGRITLTDVDAAATPSTTPRAVPPPRSAEEANQTRVPHTPMRRRIAERMARSVADAPHVTAVFEADFSAIVAHRAATRAAFEARGVALSYTAYIVGACVAAMRAVPQVNAAWGADALTLFEDVNIGVGTALGDAGLVVPVVHHAQSLSLEGIATRLADVAIRARSADLTPADVAHGTFTVSNHGVSGSLFATPIILFPPQVAILGVGKLEKRVVVREIAGVDAIQVRPMAYVSLTIDHRALDGATCNAWLAAFVAAIEGWGA